MGDAGEEDTWTGNAGHDDPPAEFEQVDEYRQRQMLAHLPYFAVMIDSERRFRWVNRLDSTLSLKQVIGKRVDDFIQPEYWPLAATTIERAFTTGEVQRYEACAYGEGEMATWYGTTVVPLPVTSDGRERALLLSSDVTKQRQAELALRKSEGRFRQLTESSPDFIAIVDQELRVRYLNRSPPEDTGLAREDVLGMSIAELTDPKYLESAKKCICSVFETGEPGTYESTGALDRRDYSTRVILLSEGGSKPQALLIATDITQQRRADAERKALEQHLQDAQKLETVGQLAGGVAHDFNNLLLVMQTHLEFARSAVEAGEDPLPELDAIAAASQRAQEITRGLLTIGRRQPHQPRILNLTTFIQSTMKLLRRVIPESMEVEVSVGSEPCFIRADAGQLEQVLINVCFNARDAIDGGGRITVGLKQVQPDEAGGDSFLALTVRDTGCGMDEATLARAFEPFFTTKPVGSGTGLGLSMVHSLVSQNGGRIELDSAPGQGTSLTLLFPQSREPSTSAETQTKTDAHPARCSGTILVAEDDPSVRRIVKRVLTRAGYRVLEAENGQLAVELFGNHHAEIDLVMLDAVMPTLGGKDAYEQIARIRPGVRTLFSSGYSAEALPQSFLEARGLSLLPKPYRPDALLKAVERALGAESKAGPRTS